MILVNLAAAQAWVPERGEGSISVSYNYIASNGHFSAEGRKLAEAAAIAQSVLFDFEYGVTDKFAVAVSLPIVSSRYADTNPPSSFLRGLFDQTLQAAGPGVYRHQFLDDGSYHPTIQDFSVEARYNVLSRTVVVTPFVAAVIPSHDYAYVGEASPGRNLREFIFGTNVARRLNPFLPRAYVQGQLAFAIPQENLHVRTNRMDVTLESGYALARKLTVRGIGLWKHTFTGLHFPADLTTPEIALTHERLLKAKYWHVGGGVSYGVSSKTEIGADIVSFVSGSDTHYGTGLSLRITRSFNRKIETAK